MEGEAREKRSGKRLCISAESIIVVGIALRRRRCTRPTKANIQREEDRRGTRRYRAKRLFALFGPVLARARFEYAFFGQQPPVHAREKRKGNETKRNGALFMESCLWNGEGLE